MSSHYLRGHLLNRQIDNTNKIKSPYLMANDFMESFAFIASHSVYVRWVDIKHVVSVKLVFIIFLKIRSEYSRFVNNYESTDDSMIIV